MTSLKRYSLRGTKPLKLNQSELPEYRTRMLAEQGGRCQLCKVHLHHTHAQLDHCHKSGWVRGVLCRECNTTLGRVENHVNSRAIQLKKQSIRLRNLLQNMYTYMMQVYPTNPIHPKHLTDNDKLRRRYRKLIKTSKKEETKNKYRKLLNETTVI